MSIARDCVVIKRGGATKIVSQNDFEKRFESKGYKVVCTSEEYAEKIANASKGTAKKATKKADA